MKKEYEKPLAELIEFVPKDGIMNGLGGLPEIDEDDIIIGSGNDEGFH